MDRDIGRLLDKLEELGIDGDTVVMFASDNGPHKEGGADPGFFNSSGPVQGIKRDLYDGGIRTPFIVRWPGRVKAGSTSDHISAFWDFLPTASELAGANPPNNIDGISMVPTLLGTGSQKQHEYLYWEFHERGGKQAVRIGDYKAVRLNIHKEPNSPLELYNLADDLHEDNNIASEQPDLIAKIESIMKSARTDSEDFPIPRKGKRKRL
jgi:arylsulfatase A-like enzyme